MSTQMQILAIGPHTPALAEHYEYPADHYAHIAPGKQIATTIGEEIVTLQSATEIADLLGADLGDPGTWIISSDAELPDENPTVLPDRAYNALRAPYTSMRDAGFRFLLLVDR
ncbi:hypothetical protein CKO28_02710 [Rhodovibrio sodomensis]|uniref:Uncharacterized protein n=1 Tax=Rhodovibrio sodomensis TaxID=1088 RepID=A0ABS1D965_9PROT|nr:hypothetical protein [Rhodovibrio sodomensis]MBK1666954.1 hypothetical protein [Rhodovibrio sodomensis]